jgi:hypothetical protein
LGEAGRTQQLPSGKLSARCSSESVSVPVLIKLIRRQRSQISSEQEPREHLAEESARFEARRPKLLRRPTMCDVVALVIEEHDVLGDSFAGGMRHTHATNLAINGAGLERVQQALGQATLQLARRYAHLAAEHVRADVAKLPSLGPVRPAAVASLDGARRQRIPAGYRRRVKRTPLSLNSGAPERNRTSDQRLRRPLLYPAELRAQMLESTTA